jgi:cyanophycinase-like exopeptidase
VTAAYHHQQLLLLSASTTDLLAAAEAAVHTTVAAVTAAAAAVLASPCIARCRSSTGSSGPAVGHGCCRHMATRLQQWSWLSVVD